jgi:hypothetical protein
VSAWREASTSSGVFAFRAGVALALAAMCNLVPVIHLVAIIGKTNRSRLVGTFPSRVILHRWFRRAVAAHGRAAHGPLERCTRGSLLPRYPAANVLQWAAATRFIKSIRDAPRAARAFAELLHPTAEAAAQVLSSLRGLSYNTLRLARVRVGIMSMLGFHRYFQSLDGPVLNCWMDSSPGWLGLPFSLHHAMFEPMMSSSVD